ncbi:MAG: DNA-3-methyladenine glycosylase, partial [Nitrospiraceae bacterium]
MALLTIKRCPASGANHFDACSHLMQADSVLPRIIMQVGTCTLRKRRDAFATLCDSIISQQLSPAAATTIYDRFAQLYPNRRPTPQLVIRTSSVSLRTAGLSGQKAGYLRDLASGF